MVGDQHNNNNDSDKDKEYNNNSCYIKPARRMALFVYF